MTCHLVIRISCPLCCLTTCARAVWWVSSPVRSRCTPTYILACYVKKIEGQTWLQGWLTLMQHPRWQLKNGLDYIFFHPHPDFAQGPAAAMYKSMLCYEIYRSLHIVSERSQFHECQVLLWLRLIYLFNRSSSSTRQYDKLLMHWQQALLFVTQRSSLDPKSMAHCCFLSGGSPHLSSSIATGFVLP